MQNGKSSNKLWITLNHILTERRDRPKVGPQTLR